MSLHNFDVSLLKLWTNKKHTFFQIPSKTNFWCTFSLSLWCKKSISNRSIFDILLSLCHKGWFYFCDTFKSETCKWHVISNRKRSTGSFWLVSHPRKKVFDFVGFKPSLGVGSPMRCLMLRGWHLRQTHRLHQLRILISSRILTK